MTQNQSPIDHVRDGNLCISIWLNPGSRGEFYTCTFSRSYQDSSGNYADASTFTGQDLLRLSLLAQRAYVRIAELRQERRSTPEADADEDQPDLIDRAEDRRSRASRDFERGNGRGHRAARPQ